MTYENFEKILYILAPYMLVLAQGFVILGFGIVLREIDPSKSEVSDNMMWWILRIWFCVWVILMIYTPCYVYVVFSKPFPPL